MEENKQVNPLQAIEKIASDLGLNRDDIIMYGHDKAKLSLRLLDKEKTGNLILMTAMSPTPTGEGKTTMNIGLSMALNALGYRAISALREPSLGPVFGLKGGATGGGKARIEPSDDINLHFTGDLHAITAANNLLAAMIDNHVYHGNDLNIDPTQILWKRAMDMNDRALRKVGLTRTNTSFDITAASEIMAILCLAENRDDLRTRLANIAVALDVDGNLITAHDLGAVEPMMVLLKDALLPNLVQTSEGTPVIVHGGPFANIAHGCNSVIATKMALGLSDYVVTEAGFGADLGAQKFFDIKSRQSGIDAKAVVVVATLKALKYHGGLSGDALSDLNLGALDEGFKNLKRHIENMKQYQDNVIVALNRFPDDSHIEVLYLFEMLESIGVEGIECDVFGKGSQGALELAKHVVASLESAQTSKPLEYQNSLEASIHEIATRIYRARGVNYSDKARLKLQNLEEEGYGNYPVCIAKTQYSFSDDPKKLNVVDDFELNVTDIRVSRGAGFVVVLCGNVMTMPGMPKRPNALKMKLDDLGNVSM